MTPPPPGTPGQWPSAEGHRLRRPRIEDGPPGGPNGDGDTVVEDAPAARAAPSNAHPIGTIVVIGTGVAVLFVVLLVVVFLAVTGGEERLSGNGQVPAAATSAQPPPVSYSPPSTTESTTGTPYDDGSGKIRKLGDHPMLQDPGVGLPNLACHLPPWRNDPAAAEGFFHAATACLDAAWEPLLQRYELPFSPPKLVFPTGDRFESQCGSIEVGVGTAAYYCEGELFLPFEGLQTDQYGNSPGVYLALLAHEYGHHVQELAGIMDAVWERIYGAGEHTALGEEMSRRKELQAQCFSGMFLGSHVDRGGSVNRVLYDQAWDDQETRGDDTSGGSDHGNNENYAAWWRTGAVDNRIVDCNTFTASPSEVR